MSPTATPPALTGSQKAAVLLVQLGREHAAKVLSLMGPVEVEELAAEIASLGSLDASVADDVVTEFHELAVTGASPSARGGLAVARDLLELTMGAARADDVLERVAISTPGKVFEFLLDIEARQLLSFLAGEHPQTIALVLAHLAPAQASTVLAGLPGGLQGDVAHRIAVMDRPDPDLVEEMDLLGAVRLADVEEARGSVVTVVRGLEASGEIVLRREGDDEFVS